jgi:(E)-2-((N-methylformamido)methylene)succinate hydrolase
LKGEGHGPPLILLHGVGLDHEMWDAQVKALTPEFKVITYDLLGHGSALPLFSSPKRRLGSSLKRNASLRWHDGILEGWVRQLGDVASEFATFSLIGFSFGGLIAQAFAAAYPERIDKLVLMNTVYNRSPEERADVAARLALAKEQGPLAIIEAAIARWFSPEFAQENPEVIETVEGRLRCNDAQGFLSAYEAFATADQALVGELAGFAQPTLVMTGELDRGSTPAMARALAATMPHAECFILRGGRHMMPMERAHEVNARLVDFLGKGR